MLIAENKSLKRKIISSSTSVVISLSLVLFIIGLLALILINTQRLTDYIKENVGFTIMLKQEITDIDNIKFQKEIESADFTKNIKFITQQEATKKLQLELGEDFVQFLGYNPLLASIDVKLNAAYANPDSLKIITKKLNNHPVVFEAYYQEDLVKKLNDNLYRLSLFLFIFSLLLFFIAFVLINNTIRLSVYSKRLLIRTMKLVGATDVFIQKPFLIKSMYHGLYSSIFAVFMLIGTIKLIQKDTVKLLNIDDLKIVGIVLVLVFLSGLILSVFSTFFAVKKYIRLNENELYK